MALYGYDVQLLLLQFFIKKKIPFDMHTIVKQFL